MTPRILAAAFVALTFFQPAAADEQRPAEIGLLVTVARSATDPTRSWLVVRGVGPGTPAEIGGLKAGDLIVAINDKPITFANDLELLRYLAKLEVGKPATFSVVRERVRQAIEVIPRRMSGPQYEQWKANIAALQARQPRKQ